MYGSRLPPAEIGLGDWRIVAEVLDDGKLRLKTRHRSGSEVFDPKNSSTAEATEYVIDLTCYELMIENGIARPEYDPEDD